VRAAVNTMKNISRLHIALFIYSTLLTIGCEAKQSSGSDNINDEKIPVPVFSISIDLSDNAKEKLKNSGETIKGSIVFDGDGEPISGIKTAPHRNVVLGIHKFELSKPGTINIADAVISKEAYMRLTDQNYHFTINVFSGRKVFENNILDGGYADGRVLDFKENNLVKISCRLL
jgi:hypothetical protein